MATTYVPIQTIECVETTSTITFSNIPQDYTDLVLRMNILNIGGGSVRVIFNNSNASIYNQVVGYQGNGSTFTSNYDNGVAYFTLDYFTPNTTRFTTYLLDINSYSSTTLRKAVIEQSGDAGLGHVFSVGTWNKTPIEAITSIRLEKSSGSFAAGSTATIYGIKAGSPKALGGDLVYQSGGYWIHEFRSSGTFVPSESISVDYLVVAGGGGGGTNNGGGGGAGGLRSTVTATGGGGSLEAALSMNATTTYAVVVGAGGSAYSSPSTGTQFDGTQGSSSFISGSNISTITSIGGGKGAGYLVARGGASSQPGGNGGSGGGGAGANSGGGGGGASSMGSNGAGNTNSIPGTGTSGQGYAGGYGADGSTGGAGGPGVSVSITGSSVTYAGGGGGSGTSAAGAGGSGGGGAGAVNGYATAGTANRGGGGGGCMNNTGNNGGSGIIILRYAA